MPYDFVSHSWNFEQRAMTLNSNMEKFVAAWADVASKWGVNRTVAKVHALYFLSAKPLSVDDVASSLLISRSHASASLREMEGWGLIKPVHVPGDRKQYYEAKKDLWEVFRIILDEQRRRVIDPSVEMFKECLDEQARTAPEDGYAVARMQEVLSFFNAFNKLSNELERLPFGPIQNIFRITAKIKELLA